MKILATFDRSPYSEEALPLVARVAALPDAEVVLFSVADEPHGRRNAEVIPPVQSAGFAGQASQPMAIPQDEPRMIETKDQAIERRMAQVTDYLHTLRPHLPESIRCTYAVDIDENAAAAIIRVARREQPDVIVMATHGRSGLAHALIGSVAEKVGRSGIAPVLLVHPTSVKRARGEH